MSRYATLLSFRHISKLWNKPTIKKLSIPNETASFVSDSSQHHLLDFSSILLQDGSDIHDLPLLIRRMDPKDFPFVSMTNTSDTIRQASLEDFIFSQRLSNCKNIYEILDLLEVPDDIFTAASAAFALHRLCQLSVNLGDNVDYYVRKPLLVKLCQTTCSGLPQLSNESVINLVGCYLNSSIFADGSKLSVDSEIERRIADGVFSLPEICRIVDLICSSTDSNLSLAKKAWTHIGCRIHDINNENLALIFKMMKYPSPKESFFWGVLSRRFQSCWWKLNSTDMATIMESLAFNDRYQVHILSATSKWLFMNIHDVPDAELIPIVGTFTHFKFSNEKLIHSLERYMKLKVDRSSKMLVAMVMDHCWNQRYLSTIIFDAVASDFEKNGQVYDPTEIHLALRPFGLLNYLPPNSYQFLTRVDTILFKKFTDFDLLKMLELVASFMYLEKFAINLISKLQVSSSVSRLQSITDVSLRQRYIEYYLQLQVSTLIEIPHLYLHNLMDRLDLKLAFRWKSRYASFHRELGSALFKLLSPQCLHVMASPGRSPYVIDFEVLVTSDGKMIPFCVHNSHKYNSSTVKLAILIVMPEYYCVNQKHLLGEYVAKHRHLQKMSYKIIPVEYDVFQNQLKEKSEKEEYLCSLLKPYIVFDKDGPVQISLQDR